MNFNKYFPVFVFLVFLGLILGATLYYSPSWGLMDDCQNLRLAQEIWGAESFLGNLWAIVKSDFKSSGVFRPVYYTWVAFTYHFFRNSPATIYSLIVIFNMMTGLIWGLIFHRLFFQKEDNKWINIFIFPLSFFIFTAFWNIFMYISLQEKFVYFFSAFALYFLIKGYDRNNYASIFIAESLLLLGILTKPTSIYLVIAVCFFAFLDIIFFNYKRRISYFTFIFNISLFVSYYIFSVRNLRGYTSGYRLNLIFMVNKLSALPAVLKLLIIYACILFVYIFIKIARKKNRFKPTAVLIPLGFFCYILVFLPWGLPTYLLSAATPYVLGMFFPLYAWGSRKSKVLNCLDNSLLFFMVAMIFIFIIVPRISRMADIKNTEDFINKLNLGNANNIYFYPPPFQESAYALKCFTGANIYYFADSVLSKEKLKENYFNYFVFRDEYAPVMIKLKDVRLDREIYHNNTWRIIQIVKEDGHSEEFKIDFPQNFIARIKSFLKAL